MKKLFLITSLVFTVIILTTSCGSSRKAAEAEKRKQEQKQKSDQMDKDKRRFEQDNNKDLK